MPVLIGSYPPVAGFRRRKINRDGRYAFQINGASLLRRHAALFVEREFETNHAGASQRSMPNITLAKTSPQIAAKVAPNQSFVWKLNS